MNYLLTPTSIEAARNIPVQYGWGGFLGEYTMVKSRYSRKMENGQMETWHDISERVMRAVAAVMSSRIKSEHRKFVPLIAHEMLISMVKMHWSPPGRGLEFMGTEYGMLKPETLQNCGFRSTKTIAENKGEIFEWILRQLAFGEGIGSDMQGAGKIDIVHPLGKAWTYVVPDTREGWAESVRHLFDSYTLNENDGYYRPVEFDYSLIRPEGSPLKGMGGTASGPDPLILLHTQMRRWLDLNVGKPITVTTLANIINGIGHAIVTGNIRRSSEILLGEVGDLEFLNLKNYRWDSEQMRYVGPNAERSEVGYASNNSVAVRKLGVTDYAPIAQRSWENGDPGVAWLVNFKNGEGFNPCGEMELFDGELCNVVEVYMSKIPTFIDFRKALRSAYLYAKTVTILSENIGDAMTREVMMKHRRVGVSLTGQAEFISKHGQDEWKRWMTLGAKFIDELDIEWSSRLGIPLSIALRTVKPSGTVSLVVGATPGIHDLPVGRYHIRRIRLQDNDPLLQAAHEHGYRTERAVESANSWVVEIPVDAGPHVRSEEEVPFLESVERAFVAQELWSDNGVSFTGKFWKEETTPDDIRKVLEEGERRGMKGISMFPHFATVVPQLPYESISEERYKGMVADIEPFSPLAYMGEARDGTDRYCEGDKCLVNFS